MKPLLFRNINYISSIINSKLYLFNKIRKYISCKTALILYKSSILSYFDVGDNAANKTILSKLQVMQNKALRCIFCDITDCNTNELHVKANLLKLQDRRNANLATLAHSRRLDCFELCRNKECVLRLNDTRVLKKPLAKVGNSNEVLYTSQLNSGTNVIKILD